MRSNPAMDEQGGARSISSDQLTPGLGKAQFRDFLDPEDDVTQPSSAEVFLLQRRQSKTSRLSSVSYKDFQEVKRAASGTSFQSSAGNVSLFQLPAAITNWPKPGMDLGSGIKKVITDTFNKIQESSNMSHQLVPAASTSGSSEDVGSGDSRKVHKAASHSLSILFLWLLGGKFAQIFACVVKRAFSNFKR
jgi:hypothetical protein